MDIEHLLHLIRQVQLEWLIRGLVLTSMLVQLVLVVCGARRYISSSRFLRLLVWGSYILADAVAISALGTMMHSAQSGMYAIWAPLLLLHLGGPDAITAYALADNELWLRHAFTMVYQVSVAAYVIYTSKQEGFMLAAGFLLLFAGASKYVERTAALAFASNSHIVDSAEPIYKFMEHGDKIEKDTCKYLVMGEKQWYDWFENSKKGGPMPGPIRGVITIEDVWRHESRQRTGDYLLCLSYALFKMYKRRCVSLYFHEWPRKKTREFFLTKNLECENVFRVVEMELKFIYDSLFSKSSGTAFTLIGALMRLLNISLLGTAGFLILSGLGDKQFKVVQRTVSYVLISVALVVEVYQFCRVMASDWTMVWLICANIQNYVENRQRSIQWYTPFKLQLIQRTMCLLQKVRKRLGNQYWKNVIRQYSVIDTCLESKSSWIWKVARKYPNSSIVLWYIRVRYTKEAALHDEVKHLIFSKLEKVCSPDQDIATCREKAYAFDECLPEEIQWASKLDTEDLILTWHIATAICEGDGAQNRRLDEATTLSRYCAHLLVSRPNLLPLHPDIARKGQMKLHNKIVELVNENRRYQTAADFKRSEGETKLGSATKLANQLLSRGDRWEVLREYWTGLLIYFAVYNKSTFHAECLTAGGEFLTHVWVLLGHMGCGEQSDSAVSKKIEDKSIQEKEERERERREMMREIERDREIEREMLTEMEREIEIEIEMEREREIEMEREIEVEREREIEMEREREIEREREREVSMGMGREREVG